MKANPEEIVSILREEIQEYDTRVQCRETGTVLEVGDGIATVYGLDKAVYGELVELDTGVKGMVMNLSRDSVGVVLLGSEAGVKEGTVVRRTGRPADVPVGDGMIGRVVNVLGEPIDGLGPIETTETRPIEHEASGVVTREPVNVPLQTGILAIDAMVPIGRGQRELIIGDRQTGKTAIAVDTILNQKGQDVICIYVAIGQKASTVARIQDTLKKHGAMAESVQRDIASFPAWPLALKAEYARDIAPRVRAIVDSGDLTPLDNGAGPNLYVIAAAAYDYGLPGEGDLAQEDALERARETVRERFGLSQEALSRYTDVLVYFDATDPDAPLWRFVFQPEMDAQDALGQTQYDLRYRVEIASRTGEVASAEAFERQIPAYNLSYLMNLY